MMKFFQHSKHYLFGCSSLLAIAMLSAGCESIKETYQDLKPIPLPSIEKTDNTFVLKRVFDKDLGANAQQQNLKLQANVWNNKYYAANSLGHVYALNNLGQKIWVVSVGEALSTGVAVGSGLVVVGTRQGNVVALDPKNGGQIWKKSLDSGLLSPSLIAGQYVVSLANNGVVTALDAKTGQPVWTFDIPRPASLSMHGSAMPILYDKDTVIVGSTTGRIYGLDLNTGDLKWDAHVALSDSANVVGKMVDIQGEPLLVGERLFTVSYQGQLTASNIAQKKVLWQQEASSLRTLAAGQGNVYVAEVKGTVSAYNQQTGALVWTQANLTSRQLSNPVVMGDHVIVGDQTGYLHIIEQTEGKIVGRVKTTGGINTLRVIHNTLLVQTTEGHFSTWQAN